MRRSNTRIDDLEMLISAIDSDDIEAAINECLNADDRKEWLKGLSSKPSKRYFLLHDGEKLDAKAIAKAALRAKAIPYEDRWHSDPMIDLLEYLEYPIWDVKREGDYDEDAALVYENTRRLARGGQQRFKRDALKLWNKRCAVSGVKVAAALEAAHIVPHAMKGTMRAKNSIVLRADIHRLFDANLMAINPKTMTVQFRRKAGASYPDLTDQKVSLPKGGPSAKDFDTRWKKFKTA